MGWGSLILAAGVGFYFAKTEINERRQKQAAAGTRPTEKLDCTFFLSLSLLYFLKFLLQGKQRSSKTLPKLNRL